MPRFRSCNDIAYRLGEVGKNRGTVWQPSRGFCFRALAGQHQDRPRASSGRRLKVAQGIANAGYASQINIKSLRDVYEHTWLRLAAVTVVTLGVQAIEQGSEEAAHLGK